MMASQVARGLNQSLNEVEMWQAAKLFAYHDCLADMISLENRER